jgi:hypothetical protein
MPTSQPIRFMIMRFRPANMRLINRRSSLLRLLLALFTRQDDDLLLRTHLLGGAKNGF